MSATSVPTRCCGRGGHLAFWRADHVFPAGGDRFFAEIQEVYDDIGEGVPDDHVYFAPGELPDQRAEIEASGLFEVTEVRHVDWETTYDADGYLALLDTFSGHIAMEPAARGTSTPRSAAASPCDLTVG